MKLIPTRVGRVAAQITGRGSPIVLLHSGGHDRHDFDAILPALAERFQTIAIDLPGHGDSDMFDPPSSTQAHRICEAIEDVVDALRLPPAVFLGNSVGGMACLHVAAQRPERVRALLLVSPSGLVEQSAVTRAFCWLQGRELVRRMTGMAFARWYLKKRNEHTDALLLRMQHARSRPDFIAMEAALWRSFGAPGSDLSARVSVIRCPTLLAWGKADPVLRSRVEGVRARALLDRAQWIDLDAGHVPFVEDPDAFLAAIEPFLSRVCAPHAFASDARGEPA